MGAGLTPTISYKDAVNLEIDYLSGKHPLTKDFSPKIIRDPPNFCP